MIKRTILSILVCLSLTNCGVLSDSGSASDLAVGGLAGAAIGAGAGAAIGAAISNGNVEKSALLGAGVGLAVGAAGTYAYKEIKVYNRIKGNDKKIESNRQDILIRQSELDRLRQELEAESSDIQIEEERLDYIHDGATLGNYYR